MSHPQEILTGDPQMWEEIMAKPLRYRQLSFFDWMLPPDNSLEIYRQNLKALGRTGHDKLRAQAIARHPGTYGHEADYDRHRKCRTCTRLRKAKDYRLAAGIPLDAPLMSPQEAGQRAVAARKRRVA